MVIPIRALLDFPRWLFLGTLFYAPWLYGCTEPEAITGLNTLLAIALASWTLGLAIRGEGPLVPRPLAWLVAGVLVLGWGVTLNARYLYDPAFNDVVALTPSFPLLPGTVERALSLAFMVRITTCLGSLLLVADLVRRPLWQLRLWWTLGAAGVSIALLRLAQKVTSAPMIFWRPLGEAIPTFFATYYYHANAGAFLNLILPAAGCLALRSVSRENAPGARVVWISGLSLSLPPRR